MSSCFISTVIASSVGYQCFNSALDLGYVPQPPGKYAGADRHKWRNAATSCFSALVMSTIVVYCLLNPDLWLDPFSYSTKVAEAGLAIMCGYLVYDACDIVIHTGLFKMWTVLLHHVVVALSYYVLSIEHVEIGMGIISLITEISAVFLHSRQLLLIYGFSKRSLVFGVHKIFNILTSVVCRLVAIAYVCYVSVFGGHPMPAYMAVLIPLLSVIVFVINCAMFWRLLRSDFLSSKTDKMDFIMEN